MSDIVLRVGNVAANRILPSESVQVQGEKQ